MSILTLGQSTSWTRLQERVYTSCAPVLLTTSGGWGTLADYCNQHKHVPRPRYGDLLILPDGQGFVMVPPGRSLVVPGPFYWLPEDISHNNLDAYAWKVVFECNERQGERITRHQLATCADFVLSLVLQNRARADYVCDYADVYNGAFHIPYLPQDVWPMFHAMLKRRSLVGITSALAGVQL